MTEQATPVRFSDAIARLERARSDEVARVATMDRALAALRELVGDTPSANALAPRIVVELGREMTAVDVLDEITLRGVQLDADDPLNAIRTGLSHAAQRGILTRVGYGRYQPAR